MTQKELDRMWFDRLWPVFFGPDKPKHVAPHYYKLWDEHDCRAMINSLLIYHREQDFDRLMAHDRSYGQDYLGKYVEKFGYDKVKKFYAEQVEDWRKGHYGPTATDWEGCTYETFRFADE